MKAVQGKIIGIVCVVFLLAVSGCAEGINKTAAGALAGAAVGAGSGAIIGNQTGRSGAGVAIGAGIGALGGALAGNQLDRLDKENKQLEDRVGQNQRLLDENRRLIEELRKRGAEARTSDRGVVINLPDILFQFDRARLTPEAHRTLDEIIDVVRTVKDRPISVEGHTDSVGTVMYNKQLSLRRARAVSQKLASRGVPRGQITVTGYGEGAPIATNNSDAGRARNRRVEIIIEN